MPNGPQKITGLAFDPTLCQSEHNIADEEVKKLLTTSTKKKANKKPCKKCKCERTKHALGGIDSED